MRFLEFTTEIWNKDRPILSAAKCSPWTLLSANIKFMRIHLGFRGVGRQTTMGWLDPAICNNFDRRIFRTFRVEAWPILLLGVMNCRVAFPMTLEWPWDIFYAKISFRRSSVWLDFSPWVSGTATWKRMKILPYCLQQKMFTGDFSFWWLVI